MARALMTCALMTWRWIGLSIALLAFADRAASADDPKLTPGRDPGGVAVAVLADGFDYTRPALASVLARDGEGEAITGDAVDGDHLPFLREGRGTETALAAAAAGGVRIVAVRVATDDTASLAKGIGFAAGTPARIVLVTLGDQERGGFEVMKAAAARFDAVLFVVSLPALTSEERTAGQASANLVLFDSKDAVHAAAEAVARAFGCAQQEIAAATGADLKLAFLARLTAQPPAACAPEASKPE